jgi:hypothetical protein
VCERAVSLERKERVKCFRSNIRPYLFFFFVILQKPNYLSRKNKQNFEVTQ